MHGVVVVEIWQRRHANPPAGSDAIKLGEIQSNSIGDFDGYVSFNIDGIEGRISKVDSTSITLETEDRKIVLPLNKLLNSTVEVFE